MKNGGHRKENLGFTIVEILIIIVIIGILAAVSSVGYRGHQHRVADSTIKHDLKSASTAMEAIRNTSNGYPTELTESIRSSPKIALNLKSIPSQGGSSVHYSNMTPVQNGVLFHKLCGDIIADGFGKGVNMAGATEAYIQGCNVYNKPDIQINSSWGSGSAPRNFAVPVSDRALTNAAAAVNYRDSWRPDRDRAEREFYLEWHRRFVAQGGIYPITTFWDGTWCLVNQSWCAAFENLPEPDTIPPSGGWVTKSDFCIEAVHEQYSDLLQHTLGSKNGSPQDGPCPPKP